MFTVFVVYPEKRAWRGHDLRLVGVSSADLALREIGHQTGRLRPKKQGRCAKDDAAVNRSNMFFIGDKKTVDQAEATYALIL